MNMRFKSARQRKKVMALLRARGTLFTRHTKHGSVFAGVSKRYGPYGVFYKRFGKGTSAKFSIGSRGFEAGIRKKITPKLSVGVGRSSLRGPFIEIKRRKRKLRIG